MDVLEHDICYDGISDIWTCWHMVDLHDGSRYQDEKLLKDTVGKIAADPHAIVFLGGDLGEYIGTKDLKRFDCGALAPWIGIGDLDNLAFVENEHLAGVLTPIVDKIRAIGYGNHEDAWRTHNDFDVHAHLLGLLNAKRSKEAGRIPSMGYSSMHRIRWHFQSIRKGHGANATLDIYMHHGFFGGRKKGGKINNLSDTWAAYDCDLAFYGHNHDRLADEKAVIRLVKENGKLTYKAFKRIAVNSGPFVRTLALDGETASFAERKGFQPTVLGPKPVYYKPHTQQLALDRGEL